MSELAIALTKFQEERGWGKYHTPKELAAAIAIEAAELQKEFLWRKDFDLAKVKEEMADVFIFLTYLAMKVGCDLEIESIEKVKKNAAKYPIKESINKW
jgi:NTP pyrophosphatase (non-canonical NTP hydrolase)